jgi:hypothetical protein
MEGITLEDYLRSELREGKIDFSIRASLFHGSVRFYIHPDGRDGGTKDFEVRKNNLITLLSQTDVWQKAMVCGVDCYAGDENCNGYCIGKADEPPPFKHTHTEG